MIKSVVLMLIVVVGSLHGLGTITRVSLQPSDCENCGMTALGQVNLKICGGSSEPCCAIVNIADFHSVDEGQIYDYTGDNGLEDCHRYSLNNVVTVDDLSLTVYHEGSDGGQFDWVEVATSEGSIVRCYP